MKKISPANTIYRNRRKYPYSSYRNWGKYLYFSLVIWLALTSSYATARILNVGPGSAYATPCQAIAAASDGDTIEIDALASYEGVPCSWSKNGLTIRGVGGRARIDAPVNAALAEGIWVIHGNDTTIENVELSGAFGEDAGVAAVRLYGERLTVRDSYFHDNANGLWAADGGPESYVLIEDSEFSANGLGDGESHNISIGHVGWFGLRYSYSHDAKLGHLVQSRAAVNFILSNRLTTEESGDTIHEIDLPHGGKTYLIGNVLQKASHGSNLPFVSYLSKGYDPRNPSDRIFVINNTFVNEQAEASAFIYIGEPWATPAVIQNNIFSGVGVPSNQEKAVHASNLIGTNPLFVDPAYRDYRLQAASPAVDTGTKPWIDDEAPLKSAFEHLGVGCVSRLSERARLDIGAHQLNFLEADGPCSSAREELLRDSRHNDPTRVARKGSNDTGSKHDRFARGTRNKTLAIIGVTISDVVLNPTVVTGGNWTFSNQVKLSAAAPAGGAVVALSSSNSAVASVGSSVTVAEGATSATFLIRTSSVLIQTLVTITATYNGSQDSAVLTVNPVTLSSLTLSPSTIGGGGSTLNNKVVLNGPAPGTGAVVTMGSSHPAIATPPLTVTIGAGLTSAVFTITTTPVTSTYLVTISATYQGVTKTAVLTVKPVQLYQVVVKPSTVAGGTKIAIIEPRLDGPAPPGGMAISIVSSNPAVASAASTLVVPEGKSYVRGPLTVAWVSAATDVLFTASAQGISKTALLTVLPTILHDLRLSSASVTGGTVFGSNQVVLNGPAPPGGATVSLRSTNTAVATVPSSVFLANGKNRISFSITTMPVVASTQVTIKASWVGTDGVLRTQSEILTVNP